MVPESPTVTNNPVVVVMSVLLEPSSLLLLQEIKMELKRRRESMMSMCFTRIPISGLGEPNIYHDSGVFYKEVGRLWWEFVRVINIYTS